MRAARAVWFTLAGCAPFASSPNRPSLAPVHIGAPAGVSLESACTPTGPELCFNANDDNCNGVLDEGCGMQTGPLQFMIAWGDSAADVDLVVTDPNGTRASTGGRSGSATLHLERDCPSDGCHGQNVEN